MFLHSGASLHGHEYSHKPPKNPSQQQPPNLRRNSLLRSALSSNPSPGPLPTPTPPSSSTYTSPASTSTSTSSSLTPSSLTPSSSTPSTVQFAPAPRTSTSSSTTASSKRHSFSSFSFSPFSLSSSSASSAPSAPSAPSASAAPSTPSTSSAQPPTVSDGLRPARSLRTNTLNSFNNNPRLRTASLSAGGTTAALTQPTSRPIEHPVVRFHDPVVVDSPPPPFAAAAAAAASIRRPATTPPSLMPYGPRLRQLADQVASTISMMNEDAASVSASDASYMSDHPPSSAASSKPGVGAGVGGNHHHRTPRKSTTYLFAHPAPKLSRKKPLLNRIRPTLLMQLQKISLDARPLPVIDVYPSSLLVGNVTAPRFSKRFPRLFGINGELGLHDTILVHSDNYGRSPVSSESEGEEDSSFEHRSLMAVFSPLRGGDHSEIVLEDGTVWITTALPNGSFEFTRIDEHGNSTTARWVRRLTTKRTPAGVHDDSHSALSASEPECKFIFSVIDPQSRRHPILASLTRVTLSILDRYTTVSPSSNSRYPPASRPWAKSTTSHDTDTSNDELSQDEDGADPSPANVNVNMNVNPSRSQMAVSMLPNGKGRATLPVDEKLKNFITISSIWVSLQCGWGQGQTTGAGLSCPAGMTNSTAGSLRKIRDRQLSEPVTVSESANNNNNDTQANRGRRLSARYSRRSATFTPLEATTDQERDASPAVVGRSVARTTTPLPRKASSTGAAYVQRQKQLQQVSDTSDSERPGPGMSSLTPRRRSRAFSRLSGEFSSMVSSKLHQSPSPPHAPATPEEPAPATTTTTVSRSNSLRLPATQSDFKPSRNGRGTVSAYYATKPVLQAPEPRAAAAGAVDSNSFTPATGGLGADSLGPPWEQQRQPLAPSLPHQRTGQDLDRAGHGAGKWKKMGSWLKSRLGSH